MVRRLLKIIKEFVFPPYCLYCQEQCETKVFCPECWKLCEPPDPLERCRHCFEEVDQKGSLCSVCKKGELLFMRRAYVFEKGTPIASLNDWESFAAFAIYQWVQLEWPVPDCVIPMPDSDSISFANAFASYFDQSIVKLGAPIEEGLNLLILDGGNSVASLKKKLMPLTETFPKTCYLLSLFHDDHFTVN